MWWKNEEIDFHYYFSKWIHFNLLKYHFPFYDTMKTGEKIALVGLGAIIGAGIVWWFKSQDQTVLNLVNSRTIHNHGGTDTASYGIRGPLAVIV
jgi:hypothetical protein